MRRLEGLRERFNPRVAQTLAGLTPGGLSGLLGMRVESVEPGEVCCVLPVRPELCSAVGLLHGGALASLVDHCLSLVVYPLVEPGKWVATVEMKLNYLRAVRSGELLARARLLSLGRQVAVARVDVEEGGRLVAAAQGTLYVRDAPRKGDS